jgi:hypothetical protein
MTETPAGSKIWQITLPIPDGTAIQYKYTRGTYNYVEEWGSITGLTNRVATVSANSPTDLTQLFDDTSDTNPDDNHKAVQNWRDALVTKTTLNPGSSGVTASIGVSFNWVVKSDGTDLNTAIVVTNNGAVVAGSVVQDTSTATLTFTPTAAFTNGAYTVTVDHVIPITSQNDGIIIKTPYSFTFTVP